jgi:uncharacterized protein (TIGR03435 family)
MGHKISGPRVTFEGYNIQLLIMEAYKLKGTWQVSFDGFRDREDRLSVYYDIVARASGNDIHSRDEFRRMLQTLLADRFKLSFHHETKQMPVYALTIGKKPSKLKESSSEGECAVNVGVVTGGQSYAVSNCTIGAAFEVIANGLVDRPVIDKTGLTGKYDFHFAATPTYIRRMQNELTDISPYTAIEDLGLKLQAQNAPFDIIAVDHFEKPTAN